MPVFVIPGALREFTGHREEVRLDGAPGSLATALVWLWRECPALRDRVLSERGEVRPHVNIFIDGENFRWLGGLDAPVREGSEILLLPAISGGAGRVLRRPKAGILMCAHVSAVVLGLAAQTPRPATIPLAPYVGPLRSIMVHVGGRPHPFIMDTGGGETMVFDEIDANVGGEIACAVGRKMAALSTRHQVVAITHFPQVAATASLHFVVEKEVAGGRTRSRLYPVSGETRIQELVRMLGGGGDEARAMAASLLGT